MKMTGAQAIVETLIALGVKDIFGYPGGAIMPAYDALFDRDKDLHHILVRHEQGASIAAGGYSRSSGKVGVCLATSGPGATNLITGIADAMLDSIPILCITGQVSNQLIGSDAFQEADIIGMTIPVTKWNYQITSAQEIPSILAKAFHVSASGRPGPVLVDITKDAQFGELEFDGVPEYPFNYSKPKLELSQLQEAATLINQAKAPYILAGHGIILANASKLLNQFAAKAGIPVACTLHGLSTINKDNPLYAGMLGMHGNYAPNVLTNQADVIVALGMRFDDRVTGSLESYAKNAKIIHVDIDVAELNKNVAAHIAIHGDVKEVLEELIQLINPNNHVAWHTQFHQKHQLEEEQIITKEISPKVGDKIKMAQVVHQLSQKTQGNAIIVTDVGQHQMVTARYYDFKKINSHITSGGLGTMGFALPAAIGAKIANPKDLVIAIIGDGGFQMNIQELGVIVQENLAVKIVILNNSYLGMVRQWQEMFFEQRYSFTKLNNPDFVGIAKAYGIDGIKVETKEQLTSAIDQMLSSSGAFLLDIAVENQGKVFPMMPSGCGVSDMRLS